MKKLFLSTLLLALPLLARAHNIAVENADGVTIYYNYINDGAELEVTSGSPRYSGVVNIPEEVTYMGRTRKVTSIGYEAFYNCTGLTSVTIPNSVTSIGSEAFYGCTGLTSVTIPNSVTSIGQSAFYSCSGRTSVTIGNSVTSIGDLAFYGCSGLTSVTIPNSVTSIRSFAFSLCTSLTSVDIPNSVTSIGNYAFYFCSGLTSVTIGNSVTSIGDRTFYGCVNLTSVTIPKSVTSIENFAFYACTGLTSVISEMKNPCYIYESCFSKDVYTNTPLYVPRGTLEKYKSTDYWNKFLHIVERDMSVNNQFTLTYIVDGETYSTYTLEEGNEITPDEAPTKEGYSFSGWSDIPEIMPASDLTITGTFVPNKYKLTYFVDGGEYKSSEVEFGSAITAEDNPTKEGYTFSGWSEIPETMPASDVTITGSFTINKYKLTYTLDGEEYKTAEVDYGTVLTPEEAPIKEGYTFSGWSEIPETMPANDVTVTGTFSVNKYKLTYMVDGEEYKASEVDYGTAITVEAFPTKEGYTFSGWSEFPSTMPAEDVTVTGTFTVNKYTITYMVDNALLMTEEVTYGSTITPPSSPKEGYEIIWNSHPTTMPAYDVTIYGSYIATGINGLYAEESDKKVYTPDGKRIQSPKKGMNIIRMNDGTTKKVVVK